mgnify:CR=1 FL=1
MELFLFQGIDEISESVELLEVINSKGEKDIHYDNDSYETVILE